MTELSWPAWGAEYPPKPAYPKRYFTGTQGDMHAGEVLDEVMGPDVEQEGQQRLYQILRCHPCVGIHAFPLPDVKALTRWYAHHFYQDEKPDMIERYERDATWWATCMHGPLLDAADALLGCLGSRPVSILDIGAGPGLLLREAKMRCWETTAIEPSPLCQARLREEIHTVYGGSLAGYHALGEAVHGQFDVVTLWEVLEHCICPEETLLQVWDLLRPGGVVGICVPNEYTPGQYAACERFGLAHWWLAPPQHLWFFTPKMLQLLLRRCGFAIKDQWATFPMVEHYMLTEWRCYVGNDTLGRQCHEDRMKRQLTAHRMGLGHFWDTYNRENLAKRIGREMVFVALKKE